MQKSIITINEEKVTKRVAKHLVTKLIIKAQANNVIIYLNGELGAGKTTFCRYFIQALGYTERVKSPSYSLVENYNLGKLNIYHLDLYRFFDPEEYNFLGMDKVVNSTGNILLIEWPVKGQNFLPKADISLNFIFKPEENSRKLEILCHNVKC